MNPRELLGDRLKGVYRLLAEHGDRLFGDPYFADCYKNSRLGRPTVPARVLATVNVLQSLEGLSDQEAVDRTVQTRRSRPSAQRLRLNQAAITLRRHVATSNTLTHDRHTWQHSRHDTHYYRGHLGVT